MTTDYAALGKSIGELVQSKQRIYGDSFGKAGDILSILYPNGVPVAQYDDMLAITRVIDKLFRIATDRDALGESPWRDIAGYALLAVARVNEARNASMVPPKPLDIAGKEPVEIIYPDDPICLECGVGAIPESRTMYCSDACFLKVYPNEFAHAERWTKGEGRHSKT